MCALPRETASRNFYTCRLTSRNRNWIAAVDDVPFCTTAIAMPQPAGFEPANTAFQKKDREKGVMAQFEIGAVEAPGFSPAKQPAIDGGFSRGEPALKPGSIVVLSARLKEPALSAVEEGPSTALISN